MLLTSESQFYSMATSRSINRYKFCVRKGAAMLLIFFAMAWMPTTPSLASDAPVAASDLVKSTDQGLAPKRAENPQMRAVLPAGNAGMSGQEVKNTRHHVPMETGGFWRRVDGFPSEPSLGFGSAAMVCLIYLAWPPSLKAYRKAVLWFDTRALGVRQIVAIEDVDQSVVLTPAAVHDRGWPLDVMEQVLGAPDYAVVDPTGRNPPLILLSRERVENLEKNGEFQRCCEIRTLKTRATAARISKWIALQEDGVSCTGTVKGSV